MSKLLSIAIVAGTIGMGAAQAAQAGCQPSCCSCAAPAPCVAAPATPGAPAAPAAPADNHAQMKMGQVPAPAGQTAQAGPQTYRSFSDESSAQAQRYAAPSRVTRRTPQYLLPKSDPRKYSAY